MAIHGAQSERHVGSSHLCRLSHTQCGQAKSTRLDPCQLGHSDGDIGDFYKMTMSTLDADRVRFIAAALAQLEHDLQRAEGSDRDAVLRVHEWLFNVQHTLMTMGNHTLH